MSDLINLEVSDADLAALAGCSARYVRKLAADGKINRVGRNTFRLGDALQGVIANMHSGSGSAKQLIAERIRKLSADATLAELTLAKARSEVALISEFQRAQAMRNAIIQTNMLNVAARSAMQIVGETNESRIKAVLTKEIRDALQQASEAEIEPEELENDDEPDSCDSTESGS